MVRGAVVDAQRDSESLLDALPALLQIVLNSLDFFFKGGSSLHQGSRFLGILHAGEVDFLAQLFGRLEQFLDGLLRLLDLIDRAFHVPDRDDLMLSKSIEGAPCVPLWSPW